MKSLLEALYGSDLNPCGKTDPSGGGAAQATQQAFQLYEECVALLNREQSFALERFLEAENRADEYKEMAQFKAGFCMGARMVAEIMREEEEK